MDVRPSDILSLENKVKKKGYTKYLIQIKLLNVRSFNSQQVNFDFPVTAVIGTNGGGKSTILGAAALAYKDMKPGDFFPKSNIGDTSMENWKVEYDAIDRTINKSSQLTRNARFTKAQWRRDSVLERDVVVIPIQRTVPANEQAKFKNFIGIKKLSSVTKSSIDKSIISTVGRILAKDAKYYQRVSLKSDPSKSILIGMRGKNDYSQFHFGAGEASIIEMVTRIENADDSSLILIEEIENGLHPLATRKMVEYLIDVARRKNSQIIFTTHSEAALDVLPPSAIWACVEGVAYQGKLTIESLRALTGGVTKDAAIFVEDDLAKDLVEEMLRQYAPDVFERIEVHKSGGYPNVVDVLKWHNKNPTTDKPAVAVIDGDNPPLSTPDEKVIELPRGAPEAVVYGHIHNTAEESSARIVQRCQCPSIGQQKVVDYIQIVARDTTDVHLLFSKLGNLLGYISEIVVRRGLCSIYVEDNPSILQPIVTNIRNSLKL